MSPAMVAVGHAWAQQSAQWVGTQASGAGFFWLSLVNVAMLVGFLAVMAQRRDRTGGAAGHGRPIPGARVPATRPATSPTARPTTSPATLGAGAGARPAPTAPPVHREPAIRASDAERDRTAARVSRAMADGRLDVDEGVARLDAVYRARYRDELASIVADLPADPPALPSPWTTRFYRDLRDFAGLAVVAAVLLQVLAGVWEMWPIALGAMVPFAWQRRAERDEDRAPPA